MKMNKNRLLTGILAFVMTAALTACNAPASSEPPAATGSDKNTPAPSADTSKKTEGVVELKYSCGGDTTSKKAAEAIIADFNKKNEGKIKVNFVALPTESDKQRTTYVTAFSGGSYEYDVFDGDCVWPAEFAASGYALPLDSYIKKDGMKMTDYFDGSATAVTYQAKVVALPRYIDTGLLFYRKDIIDKAPATWDELITMAKASKGKGTPATKYGFVAQGKQYEGLVCDAVEWIAAYGGQVTDSDGKIVINSPESIKGLTKMKDLYKSADIVPKDITTFTEPESDTMFLQGESVFMRNWPYVWTRGNDEKLSKVIGKFDLDSLPKGDSKAAACLGGWVTMINKNTKHADEAWQFLKFMCGPEGQKISALEGGYAPTLKSLYQDKDIKEKQPHFEKMSKGFEAAVPRPVSPVYSKLSEIMQIEVFKMLTDKQTPEEAVKNMDAKMKEASKS